MCGRSACNQCREVYVKAASYYDEKSGNYKCPKWRDCSNGGKPFIPSCNVAPTDITPVLLPGSSIPGENEDRLLLPMMWGLIPPWHKGTYKSHGLSTNNCRIENMCSSKLYGPLLKEGKRCVVICDGFYEWQSKTKQPYFIYSTQPSDSAVEDEKSWQKGEWSSDEGWTGPGLLYMAGLYHLWKSPLGEEIYNYSIITKESKEEFSWLHHRVPAILPSPKHVQEWMDSKEVNMYEALKGLESVEGSQLAWHPVSTSVNNSSNKSNQCNKKIQIRKNTLLTSWLTKSQPSKRESDPDSSQSNKQTKKMKNQ